MKWPKLVPPGMCKVPIRVTLTDGINEDGAPAVVRVISTHCNYNGGGGWTVDAQRQAVRYSAVALFCGDLAPELPRLTGWVDVLGPRMAPHTPAGPSEARSAWLRMTIHATRRARNPDGTVNYVRLELI